MANRTLNFFYGYSLVADQTHSVYTNSFENYKRISRISVSGGAQNNSAAFVGCHVFKLMISRSGTSPIQAFGPTTAVANPSAEMLPPSADCLYSKSCFTSYGNSGGNANVAMPSIIDGYSQIYEAILAPGDQIIAYNLFDSNFAAYVGCDLVTLSIEDV